MARGFGMRWTGWIIAIIESGIKLLKVASLQLMFMVLTAEKLYPKGAAARGSKNTTFI